SSEAPSERPVAPRGTSHTTFSSDPGRMGVETARSNQPYPAPPARAATNANRATFLIRTEVNTKLRGVPTSRRASAPDGAVAAVHTARKFPKAPTRETGRGRRGRTTRSSSRGSEMKRFRALGWALASLVGVLLAVGTPTQAHAVDFDLIVSGDVNGVFKTSE